MVKYALYRGDELIGIGTSYQLAKLRGCSAYTIRWYASPAAHEIAAKAKRARLHAYRIEDDE